MIKIKAETPEYPTIQWYMSHPEAIPDDKLEDFTRGYYVLSSKADAPQSPVSRWYYACALECERRQLDLDAILAPVRT